MKNESCMLSYLQGRHLLTARSMTGMLSNALQTLEQSKCVERPKAAHAPTVSKKCLGSFDLTQG